MGAHCGQKMRFLEHQYTVNRSENSRGQNIDGGTLLGRS